MLRRGGRALRWDLLGTTVIMLLAPSSALAQATIAGIVRDTSGAVLPGVTVEAASVALIEKVRSVVTDDTGQYRVLDLRPGAYTVTFTLPGFSTVRREGIALSGSFTVTLNAEMKVGAVEETVIVTGDTPTVDIQSATRQRVMDAELIATLPTGRNFNNLGVLIPGVSQLGGQDVGGALGTVFVDLVSHGSHADAQRMLHNGVSVMALFGSGNRNSFVPNPIAYEEVTIDTGAVGADHGQGGVRVNFIPRDGGNTFRWSSFVSLATEEMQGSNFTPRLKALGLTSPDKIYRNVDINPGFGGPVLRDRIWFYSAGRYNTAWNYVPGMFYNSNANRPDVWTFAPDVSRPAIREQTWKDVLGRITWQASTKHKFAFSYDHQISCPCPTMTSTAAPEASTWGRWDPERVTTAEWSSPVSNRLLLEGVAIYQQEIAPGRTDDLDLLPQMVNAVEQGGIIPGLSFRAPAQYTYNDTGGWYYRAGLSYISGSHTLKVGLNDAIGYRDAFTYLGDRPPVSYRLLNGVPNQITLRSTPVGTSRDQGNRNRLDHEMGIHVQDRWTLNRLTTTAALRFDYYANHFPEQQIGPAPLAPTRDITFPRQDNLSWKDLTPRLSTAWDVLGTGKTAIKASLNKYVAGVGLGAIATDPNPALGIITQTTRAWNDANRNFIPDCDLLNPLANGECQPMANPNFGKAVVGTSFDPDLRRGWNKRGYDWEFGIGVQHEIAPRVSADVSYFRRWFGNFLVIDNLAVSASDYDRFSITAPGDPKLPGGGGYVVEGLYDLRPEKFGIPSNMYETLADQYGKQIEHWNGVDLSVNARLAGGTTVAGGLSTGRTVRDYCEVAAKVPELLSFTPPGEAFNAGASFTASALLPASFCHFQSPFLTQAKLLGSYTIPRIDVRISATFQSLPGPIIAAVFNVPNASVVNALGRGIAGGNPNSTIPTNIIHPGTMYGDRLNQLDLRFGKILRLGPSRHSVSLDLFNALNSDAVLATNPNYAALLRPTSVVTARFIKVSWQLDF